jgi:hypothetical protein
MNLKDFIAESLLSIIQGVQEAQEKTGGVEMKGSRDTTSGIAASFRKLSQEWLKQEGKPDRLLQEDSQPWGEIVHLIEFDIAVTITRKTETSTRAEGSLGGAIQVLGANIDIAKTAGQIEEGKESNDSRVTRIKFAVPVHFAGKTRTVGMNNQFRYEPQVSESEGRG